MCLLFQMLRKVSGTTLQKHVMWSFGRDRSRRTVASYKIDGGKKRRHVFIIVSQQEEYCHGASTQRTGTCERLGASTGLRTRERLLTQRRDLKCGIRAQKKKNWATNPGTGTVVSILRNQQIEVLLAEGNLMDGLYAVATASRPTVGSLRSILEAAFNALAASGIQCVLDFWASHDSQCSIVFHTASRCCFPLHSAGHGYLVARIGPRVRGHRYCLWCRNRCVPQRPLLQRWHVHRILRAFRGNFSPCTAGKKTREGNPTLISSRTHASLRYSSICAFFQHVYPSCGTESSELVFSLSASTERLISTGCFVCTCCAKAVRVAFSLSCCL